jgi:hypothetical protein
MLFPQIPDFEAPALSGAFFCTLLLDGHSWGAIARLGRLCERDSGVGVLHWRAVYRRGVVCLWVFLERVFLIWLALSIWCSHFRWLALFSTRLHCQRHARLRVFHSTLVSRQTILEKLVPRAFRDAAQLAIGEKFATACLVGQHVAESRTRESRREISRWASRQKAPRSPHADRNVRLRLCCQLGPKGNAILRS